jgi:uncharacterized protein
MSGDTLKALISAAARMDVTKINIIWHGGEPLLSGQEFYENAVWLQRHYSNLYGVTFANYLQTNGTLIDKSLTNFFKSNNFNVGISIDGPPSLNDLNRLNDKGLSVYKKSLHGYNLMKISGNGAGLLAVLTQESLNSPEVMADWLMQLDCHSISFNLRFDLLGNLRKPIWAKKYLEFLLAIKSFCESKNFSIYIRELKLAQKGISKRSNSNLNFCRSGITCLYNHSAIDPEGFIYLCCDRFISNGNKKQKEYCVGNVCKGGLRSIFINPIFENFEVVLSEKREFCKNRCWKRSFCEGLCIADWILATTKNGKKENHSPSFCFSGIIPRYLYDLKKAETP